MIGIIKHLKNLIGSMTMAIFVLALVQFAAPIPALAADYNLSSGPDITCTETSMKAVWYVEPAPEFCTVYLKDQNMQPIPGGTVNHRGGGRFEFSTSNLKPSTTYKIGINAQGGKPLYNDYFTTKRMECQHNMGTYKDHIYTSYEKYTADQHRIVTTYDVHCSGCNKLLEVKQDFSYEPHNWSGNTCVNCKETKQVVCQHVGQNEYHAPRYEKYSQDQHKKIIPYETRCIYCGQYLGGDNEIRYENHNWSGNTCVDCGQTRECQHQGGKIYASPRYEQYDSGGHMKITPYEVRCIYCNQYMDGGEDRQYEAHRLSGNTCMDCGYTVQCQHNGGTYVGSSKPSYERYSQDQHKTITAKDIYCSQCGQYIKTIYEESYESHRWSGDRCSLCGEEKSSLPPATTQTPTVQPPAEQKPAVCAHKYHRDEYKYSSKPQQYDSKNHKIIHYYDRYCRDCGEYLGVVEGDYTLKPHKWKTVDGNTHKCTECGEVEEHNWAAGSYGTKKCADCGQTYYSDNGSYTTLGHTKVYYYDAYQLALKGRLYVSDSLGNIYKKEIKNGATNDDYIEVSGRFKANSVFISGDPSSSDEKVKLYLNDSNGNNYYSQTPEEINRLEAEKIRQEQEEARKKQEVAEQERKRQEQLQKQNKPEGYGNQNADNSAEKFVLNYDGKTYHYDTEPKTPRFILNALLSTDPVYLAQRKSINDKPMDVLELYYGQVGPAWIQILSSWLKDVTVKYEKGEYSKQQYIAISNTIRDMLKCTPDGWGSLMNDHLAIDTEDYAWETYFRDLNMRIVLSDESYANGNTSDEVQWLVASINGYTNHPLYEFDRTMSLSIIATSMFGVIDSVSSVISTSSTSVQAVERGVFVRQLERLEKSVTQAQKDAIISETAPLIKAAAEAIERAIINAKAEQRLSGYKSDEFTGTILPKGTRIYGGLPGQTSWYTNFESLEASRYSRSKLFQGLQVQPHPEYGYRPQVGVYELLEDVPVAEGKALMNTQYGFGGYHQYFVEGFNSKLKLIKTINLGN